MLQIGTLVKNYKLVRELGKSPFGGTFLAQTTHFDQNTGRPSTMDYLVKTVYLDKVKELDLDPEIMLKELAALKKISESPTADRYMSTFYDYFVPQGQDYLVVVSEYIRGTTLQKVLLEMTKPFDTNKILQLMYQLAQAVDFIHIHGIAHQNLKPSNVIQDTRDGRLKLIDFSLSCSRELNQQCRGKPGAVYYMPPELVAKATGGDQQPFTLRMAHDIWSMGAIFFQMANLHKNYMNFLSNDPQQVAKDIVSQTVNASEYPYEPVNKVIAEILVKDPAKRPTAGQVLMLIMLARPLCIINNVQYDRQESEALIVGLGLDVNLDADDYTLCKVLTDHLNMCSIGKKTFQKTQLIALAKVLQVPIPEKDIDGGILCNDIQRVLEDNKDAYSERVTETMLRAIYYMAWLRVRGEKPEIYKMLAEKYQTVYSIAQELGLLNVKLLYSFRDYVTLKEQTYTDTSPELATVYRIIGQTIVDMIKDNE